MSVFEDLKDKLGLNADHRLMLEGVPMILTPRWFFVGIMGRVMEEAGPEMGARIYYKSGYDGAYKWCKNQIQKGLSGRAVMEQYLNSMSHRGWGRFEIRDFDEAEGKGNFRLYSSAVALELGQTGKETCLWVAGALAGGFEAVLEQSRAALKVRGREIRCLSKGDPYCEFVLEPL
jgi:predicted hydrocarbon binding protein